MATDPQLRLQRQDGTDLAAIFHDDAADETVIESLQTGEQWRFRDNGNAIFPGDFDAPSGTIDNLDSASADIDVGSVSTQFQPPRYDTVAAAPDKEGVILVPSSGTDTAGLYLNDGSGYELLDESGGASAGSLSGLDIDTDKDFGGFKLTGMGHDEVDVPQVQERTVADFEGGTLPADAVGDTGNATVQDSVVLEGDYSLELSADSSDSVIGLSNTPTTPQFGDSFTAFTQLTDTDDQLQISLFAVDAGTKVSFSTGLRISLLANRDDIDLNSYVAGSRENLSRTSAPLSNNLNERLRLDGEISTDGEITVTLSNSSGEELATVSHQIDNRIPSSGGVQFRARNPSRSHTIYYDFPTLRRRESEDRARTKEGITELGNEVTPSGRVGVGTLTSDTNASRAVVSRHPTDSDATQGADSKLTLAESGGRPAAYLDRTLDGQGGVTTQQVQAPLGRFARLNANLSWEYESLADAAYTTGSATGTHSVALTGRPRRLQVEHDGTGGGGFGGVVANSLSTFQSLGAFRITFHNVDITDDGPGVVVGVSNQLPDADAREDGTGFTAEISIGGQNIELNVVDNGTVDRSTKKSFSTPTQTTLSLEYDGSEVRLYEAGNLINLRNFSGNGDLSPILQTFDNGDGPTTLSVEQITVEPLAEVLQ